MNDLTSSFLKSELGNSFYKELYHLKDSENTVVLNEATGDLLVCKRLNYFDLRVFDYLKNHPHKNIARIHDFKTYNNELIVYEEFIQGVTLSDYLKTNPKESDLNRIINDLFDAVSFIHRAKPSIIHRDIKMSNVMITKDGVLKLIDFDAAKCFNPNSSQDTVLLGTEGFAAPEQYGFGSSDVRTDIYGLGKLLKEIYGNKRSYTRLISKATHIDPNQRYSSVAVLKKTYNNGFILLPFPGFRNSDPTHTFKSIVGYIVLLWAVFGSTFENFSYVGTRIAQLFIIGLCILWIDMLSGGSPIFTRMPLTSSENALTRLIGNILYMLISFIATFILISLIVVLFRL